MKTMLALMAGALTLTYNAGEPTATVTANGASAASRAGGWDDEDW